MSVSLTWVSVKEEKVQSGRDRTKVQLIGGQRIFRDDDPEQQLPFYEELFTRLPQEVLPPATLTRYVAYQAALTDTHTLHFLGVEVADMAHLSGDMAGWELTGNAWRLWRTEAGQLVLDAEQALTWRWSASGPASDPSAGFIGEFTALLPTNMNAKKKREPHRFRVSGHAYVRASRNGAGETRDHDAIALVDHDPAWAEQFVTFAAWLRETCGTDLVHRVEHYGSTAIPGIPAKPVIDVLVEIPSFIRAKPTFLARLNDPRWEYWWYSNHMVFIKRDALMGKRTHHVHAAPRGHPVWEGLTFRDYLREHPAVAARYATLKRELADQYHKDRERYTHAKSNFVQDVLAKAKRQPPGE